MPSIFETAPTASAIPISFATRETWEAVSAGLPAPARQFALANGFAAKPGACLTLPAADGQIAQVLFGLEEATARSRDLFRPGALPGLLPPGVYRFANAPHDTRLATLAFALGSYRFGRYRKNDAPKVRLVPSDGIDIAEIARMADAATLARDLINTPSNDMGPEELADAAGQLARRFGASFGVIVGDDLTRQNFPLIHAVGMASTRAPRLIDFCWGDPAHPKVTLVGKGVCFDTGGLDLKPSAGMLIMKKDMGGAANVLALAQMVMDAKLKAAAARADPRGRERGRRQRLPAARHLHVAQGSHRGDRQHRRRGPAGAGRRAGAGLRGEAGSPDRHGHPDGGSAGGAGAGFTALLQQ